jgi:hypothetical protein
MRRALTQNPDIPDDVRGKHEIEKYMQPKQTRLFDHLPDVKQFQDGEFGLVEYDANNLALYFRVHNELRSILPLGTENNTIVFNASNVMSSSNNLINTGTRVYTPKVFHGGSKITVDGTVTVNVDDCNQLTCTLTKDTVISFTGGHASQILTCVFTEDAVGGWVVSFAGTNIKWFGKRDGIASDVFCIDFVHDGTNWVELKSFRGAMQIPVGDQTLDLSWDTYFESTPDQNATWIASGGRENRLTLISVNNAAGKTITFGTGFTDVSAITTTGYVTKLLYYDGATWREIETGGTYTVLDTNSIDMTLTGTEIKADLKVQNTATVNLSVDANGLKADSTVVGESTTVTDTNSIDMTLTGTAVKADLRTQNSSSVDLSVDANGLKADADLLGLEDLVDPDDDRILFWDDSDGKFDWLDVGTNLTITDKTINATGGDTLPAGTEDQTLRYDNTNALVATSILKTHTDGTEITVSHPMDNVTARGLFGILLELGEAEPAAPDIDGILLITFVP